MRLTRFTLLLFTLPVLLAGCVSDVPPEECPVTPATPQSELHPQSAAALRVTETEPEPSPVAGVRQHELTFESEAGSGIMRIYQPETQAETPRAILLFLHGINRNNARFCAELALKADIAVAAPELRLGKETPWPAALDDTLAAYNFLCTGADELGMNPERIFVAGDGVGGMLAISAIRSEYDTTGEKPAGLLLFYPLTTLDVKKHGESWERYGTEFGLDAAKMEEFLTGYFPDAETKAEAGATLTDLPPECLPKTLLIVAGCDILRDQAMNFAGTLRKNNGSINIRRYNGAIHGFLTRSGLDAFRQHAVKDAASFIAAGE